MFRKQGKKKYKEKTFTAMIKIRNLTIAQSIALEDMLATWQQLGSLGCSRWTSFFADGDGNFRPKILYNGQKARFTDLISDEQRWEGSKYQIDFDSVAWRLRDQEYLGEIEAQRFNLFRVFIGTIKDNITNYISDIKIKIKLWRIHNDNKKLAKGPRQKNLSEPPSESYDQTDCDS